MNTLIKNKFKIFSLFALLAVLFLSLGAMTFVAKADGAIQSQLLLPSTNLEYKKLESPIDVYSDGEITAIAQNTIPGNSLLLYKNGEFLSSTNFTSVKQIKKISADTLLVSDNGTVYAVSCDGAFTKTALQDSAQNIIGGNYFDLNNDYLVTAFGTSAHIYTRDGNAFNHANQFVVSGDSPIVINQNGDIFFVNGNGLCTTNVNASNVQTTLVQGVAPDKMVANNEYIYYLINQKIYRLEIAGGTPTLLSVSDIDAGYELGNLIAPQSISFKGENLLIIDGNTIQEYKIEGQTLTFTGFAIAKEKTAYNRITSSALEIEKQGDFIAVLDSYKLTVINCKTDNIYARDNYKNYLKSGDLFNNVFPELMSLGDGTILLTYNKGTSNSTLGVLDLNNDTLSEQIVISSTPVIRDICYQSGYYYVLADNGSAPSNVYRIAEGALSITDENRILLSDTSYQAYSMAVDVYGNVLISNGQSVLQYNRADDYSTHESFATGTSIKKLLTDLGGNLFMLDGNELKYKNGDQNVVLELSAPNAQIKSFAIDHITKCAYLLNANEEFITLTIELPNLALSELVVPSEYVVSAPSANIDTLKIYQAKDGANVYTVDRNDVAFSFKGLTDTLDKYVYICSITQTNSFGASVTLYALAGQNTVALIDKNEILDVTESTLNVQNAPSTAFITTDVNGYFFPIITKHAEYALSDGETIRLTKESKINPIKTITFLGKDYYYASFNVGGTDYTGYVPKNFTVEVLSEAFKWNEYVIESVNKTALYLNEDLTDVICDLVDGESVRVIEKRGEVLKVVYQLENVGYLEGYISNTAIKNEPQKAIRNILIILFVSAAVCATTAFFILKKKHR